MSISGYLHPGSVHFCIIVSMNSGSSTGSKQHFIKDMLTLLLAHPMDTLFTRALEANKHSNRIHNGFIFQVKLFHLAHKNINKRRIYLLLFFCVRLSTA